jgi:Mg2+/Co2+ transporter CorB
VLVVAASVPVVVVVVVAAVEAASVAVPVVLVVVLVVSELPPLQAAREVTRAKLAPARARFLKVIMRSIRLLLILMSYCQRQLSQSDNGGKASKFRPPEIV